MIHQQRLPFISRFYLVILLLSMVNVSHAQNFDTVQIRTSRLTETVYMLEGAGAGNIGVCIGNDGTFIIDDQFAPLSEKIKTAIAKVTDRPVQFVINTHWHGDHSGGNENFGGGGAIIVSQENSRKRMSKDQFFGVPAHKQGAYSSQGLPKITFTTSMSFYYNGETIRVFHLTNAHTDGDAIIYFEKSNVVHMGDVFVRYGFPFIDEPNGGNVNGMIKTIDSVINLINEKTIIIPGHGQVSGKQDLVDYNNMIRTVRDQVKKLMEEGKSLSEIIIADPMKDFPKRGVSVKDFIEVVYNSILKSKKE